jgi:hypothetical protein
MTLSVPGVTASCEKFPHSSQLNFWSTESILNQFRLFLKTLNALCVCLQYKHHRSMKRVIRSDKPVTLLLLLWSHKRDIGAEPRSRIIATSAVKGLNTLGIGHVNGSRGWRRIDTDGRNTFLEAHLQTHFVLFTADVNCLFSASLPHQYIYMYFYHSADYNQGRFATHLLDIYKHWILETWFVL